MNYAKMILSVLLILTLMVVVILAAAGIVGIFYLEVMKSTHGIAPIAAFIIAAVCVGTVFQNVVNRIKRLWE